MGVTDRAPRKSGQQGAARHFGQCPQGRKTQRLHQRRGMAPAPKQGARGGVVQGQKGRQQPDRCRRQRPRHAAVGVHRDEQPPKAAAQPRQRKQPCAPSGPAPTGCVGNGQHQHAQGQPLQQRHRLAGVQTQTGQRQRLERPRQRQRLHKARQQQGQRPGAAHHGAPSWRVTLNQITAPPRVC